MDRVCEEDPLLPERVQDEKQSVIALLYAARANFFDRFQGVWKGNYETIQLADRDFSKSKGTAID